MMVVVLILLSQHLLLRPPHRLLSRSADLLMKKVTKGTSLMTLKWPGRGSIEGPLKSNGCGGVVDVSDEEFHSCILVHISECAVS